MGVTVITGHRLEALFEALCERLHAAPPAPMETETVLVPALGVARWLELRLADRLGIAAGFQMPFLGAWLHRLTAPTGGSTVSFSYRTSTESGYDYLNVLVDGVAQGSGWSGTTSWTSTSVPISAGTHTVMFRYSKDSSVSSGSDAVWIDDVSSGASP